MASLLFPLQFERQYSGPLDQDQVFSTTSDRLAYLTNALRYSGQIVSDTQTGKAYQLNAARDTWIELGNGGSYQINLTTLLSANSASWNNTYTTVQSNSANWGVSTINDPLKFKFIGNGLTTNYSVSGTNGSNNASYIEVFVENIRQEPYTSYTLLNDTVTFSEAPDNNTEIVVITPNVKLYNLATNQYSLSYFTGASGSGVISKTYSELKALKDANQLVSGQYYKITDFQLKWWNLSVNDNTVKTSAFVEPLTIVAIATNKFSNAASSDLYPQDIIYYNFEATTSRSWGGGDSALNSSPIPNFKGDIFRRIDPLTNVDICYDWRHITVNCCRPDLSTISTWTASTSANLYDVVKLNGKLFISIIDNNIYVTTNAFAWQPFSDYNEEYTYFPTDETFGLSLVKPATNITDINTFNNYVNYNSNAYILKVPALTSTRVQKYTFNNSTESDGSREFNGTSIKLDSGSHSNIFCGYNKYIDLGYEARYNIFHYNNSNIFAVSNFSQNIISNAVQNNSFGSTVKGNVFSYQFINNKFLDNIVLNKFSSSQTGNVFDSQVAGNFFSSGMNSNVFKSTVIGNLTRPSFTFNNLGPVYCGNSFGSYSGSNITLGSCANNSSLDQVAENTLGPRFANNKLGNFQKNEIGPGCINNIFPYYSSANKIGNGFEGNTATPTSSATGEMYYNTIGQEFQYNSIGNFFKINDIGTRMTGCTLGNVFRKNKIASGDYIYGYQMLNGIDFSSSTHVANNYDKNIFQNSTGSLRLSYYNSSDVQVVTSPTA